MGSVNNKIIIITAPSGAGKTSITRHLLTHFPQLAFSVSAATRPARANEQHGRDYYFISEDAFHDKIRNNEFVEWEMVYEGRYYGTLKSELNRIWGSGRIPVLDIDVKGAIHVEGQYPESTLTIFIQPPSIDELKRRLLSRGTESDATLQTRINKAGYEMTFRHSFQHVVVNSDLQKAQAEAENIVRDFISK
ncbi:MAG TPA: guanylate kinase [Chitinophagaceae bacterium]|nr:guanylate kinase [Chitinophagaceae bacterium]